MMDYEMMQAKKLLHNERIQEIRRLMLKDRFSDEFLRNSVLLTKTVMNSTDTLNSLQNLGTIPLLKQSTVISFHLRRSTDSIPHGLS